jgi:hypothetical protein
MHNPFSTTWSQTFIPISKGRRLPLHPLNASSSVNPEAVARSASPTSRRKPTNLTYWKEDADHCQAICPAGVFYARKAVGRKPDDNTLADRPDAP